MIIQLITRMVRGGAQRIALETVAALARAGRDAELWCGPEAGPEGSLLDEARARSLAVRIVPELVKRVDPLRDARAFLELRSALARARPEIVHTHSSKAGILGRFAARAAGVPRIFHTVHGWGFSPHTAFPARAAFIAAERAAAGCAERLIAVSQQAIEEGLARGIATRAAYALIRPGIDDAAYRDLERLRREGARVREELGISPGALLLGTVARFSPQKNLSMLLPLIPRLPGVEWLLVGDGPGRADFTRAIERSGCAGAVRMPGLRADVPACIAAMDLFLLVSLWEGLPLVVLEAGAAGVPIVSAEVGGVKEILPDRPAGWLFPAGDGRGLREAIEGCLAARSEARQAALAHRERVLAGSSIERTLAEVFALYGPGAGGAGGLPAPTRSP